MNKGIKRLGIIATVLWLTVGVLWSYNLSVDELGSFSLNRYGLCSEHPEWYTKQNNGLTCSEMFHAEWAIDVTDGKVWGQTAFRVLAPLLLAWLLAYLIAYPFLWLCRWVWRGFVS